MQEAALVRAEVARAGGELVEALVMARARQRARIASAPAKLGWKASQRLWPRGVSFEAMASIMEEGATSAGVARDIEIVFGREAPRPAIEHEEALAEIMRVAGLVMREARRAEEQVEVAKRIEVAEVGAVRGDAPEVRGQPVPAAQGQGRVHRRQAAARHGRHSSHGPAYLGLLADRVGRVAKRPRRQRHQAGQVGAVGLEGLAGHVRGSAEARPRLEELEEGP